MRDFGCSKKFSSLIKRVRTTIVLVRVPGTLNINTDSPFIFYEHESIFQLFTFPALYITLTNTLTHKDKDRETESEKEQNAPKRPRCCLLGFLLIAVVVRER